MAMTANQKILVIKTDGGARGNPGPSAIGVVILDKQTKKKLASFGEYIGVATNNMAEYAAVIKAWEWLEKNKSVLTSQYTQVHFISDSKLLVNQLEGRYKIKNANLQKLYLRIKTLELSLSFLPKYFHVRREYNKEPDLVLNKILDAKI